MKLPNVIRSEDSIRAFFTYLVQEENLNFHPDTPFSDYINYEDKSPTFTPEECAIRDRLMNQCFAVAGDRVYDIGLEVLKPILMESANS